MPNSQTKIFSARRHDYFICTEAFSTLQMFQDDTLYKLTYLLTYLLI